MKTKTMFILFLFIILANYLYSTPSSNAAAPGKDIKTAKPEEVGISSERLVRLDKFAQELIDNKKTGGIVMLIARRGKIAYHKAFGYADIESGTKLTTEYLFRLHSMTKPVTSVALLTLYEQGKFKLSDPVELYIPDFKDVKVYDGLDDKGNMILVEPKRKITIEDLFRHTSGLCSGEGEDPVNQLYQKTIDWTKLESTSELIDKLVKVPLLYQPGERWVYSDAYEILAYLVENFSGMPFDEYCTEKIFKPLGMKDTVFRIPTEYVSRFTTKYGPAKNGDGITAVAKPGEPDGYASYLKLKTPLGGSGLSSTAMDYFKFSQMLLNGGEYNNVRILGKKTVELMTSNHLPKEIPQIDSPIGARLGIGYGLGVSYLFEIAGSENLGSVGLFGWEGYATTKVMVDPKEDMVAIFLTQYEPMFVDIVSKFQTLVYQAIVK
jgi:CubicO group peptidase (beta-lactamase class C family)